MKDEYTYPPLPADFSQWRRQWTISSRIYEVLGIRGRTIPKEMAGMFTVDGHSIEIRPASGTRAHRVFVHIPGRSPVPMGRVHQARLPGVPGRRYQVAIKTDGTPQWERGEWAPIGLPVSLPRARARLDHLRRYGMAVRMTEVKP